MKPDRGGLGFLLFLALLIVGITELAFYAYHSIEGVPENSNQIVGIVVTVAFVFVYASVFWAYFRGARKGAIRLGIATTLYNLVMCLSIIKEIPLWLQVVALVIFLAAISPLWKKGILGFHEHK
ncbi:hypothetical protein BJI67_00705 [Acidihalobacter aeolianus]|uniref:Uncharacterized protein n=1 Tax=Acidihalobacter aeolianus TaxID=2792603 RepID=A0A1D8K482_9GAMM|nr:hypothetical protein [Acidihalobacter aeolianus]AOV15775.1 hypothetical protein BJI67_00705 [Acidihalobacter aeolianus]